jgi:hypothetical protein
MKTEEIEWLLQELVAERKRQAQLQVAQMTAMSESYKTRAESRMTTAPANEGKNPTLLNRGGKDRLKQPEMIKPNNADEPKAPLDPDHQHRIFLAFLRQSEAERKTKEQRKLQKLTAQLVHRPFIQL